MFKTCLAKACGHFSQLEVRNKVELLRCPGGMVSGVSNYLNHRGAWEENCKRICSFTLSIQLKAPRSSQHRTAWCGIQKQGVLGKATNEFSSRKERTLVF